MKHCFTFLAGVAFLSGTAFADAVPTGRFRHVYDFPDPDTTPVVMRGESCSDGAAAARYSIGADIYFADGSLEWRFERDFPNGTHSWVEASGVFLPAKPVRRIVLYACCTNGFGTALFRNCRIERRMPEAGERFNVQRRTLLPFEAADEVHYECAEAAGTRRVWRRKTEKVPSAIRVDVPLASDATVVWAADPFRRVTPLTFPVRGERARPLSFDLMRREAENAQVLVSCGTAARRTGLRLECDTPRSADGKDFAGSLSWQRQGYVKRPQVFRHQPDSAPSHESWLPDPLLPAAPFDVPPGGTQGLWIEAKAAAECPAGEYASEVRVVDGETVLERIAVRIVVREHSLPERFGFVTLISSMDGFLRKVYGPGWERMRRPMQDAMLDHRLNALDESRFAPPEFEDVLHACSRGANSYCLMNLVPRPKNTNTIWVCWAPAEELAKPEFYEYVKDTLSPLWNRLKSAGIERYATVSGFDERRSEFYPVMDSIWRRLQRDFPGMPLKTSAKMYFDLAHGKKGELLYTSDWFGPRIDAWKRPVTEDLHSRGKKVGFYVSEDPFYPWPGIGSYEFYRADARALFWIAFAEKADMFSYWASNYWNYKCPPLDESKTFFPEWDTWNASRMPGDGVLVYPGKNGILPSLRLAALRDGEEDHEILSMLAAHRGRAAAEDAASEIVAGLKDFSRSYGRYVSARRRIAEEIAREKCR